MRPVISRNVTIASPLRSPSAIENVKISRRSALLPAPALQPWPFFFGWKNLCVSRDEQNSISFVLGEYTCFLSLWTLYEREIGNSANR